MDDRLKRRLIGAAVLASLAVIFVPMLVEDEPVPVPGAGPGGGIPPREETTFKSQVLKEEITVPTDAPPPGEIEPSPIPALDAAVPVAVAPAPDVTPTTVEPPPEPAAPPVAEVPAEPPAEQKTESPPEKPLAPPGPPTPPPALAKPEPKAPPAEIAKAAPPTPKSAPPPRPGSRITTWIVQVGNFSTRAKADDVARQLRGKGLEVFVEPIGKPASVFRVAVGPETERSKAAALIPRIEAALPGGGKPFIRSYP